MNVAEFLTKKGVEFDELPHADTYDAQHLAQELHVSGREVAKTVLLRTERGDFALVVLPASRDVDFKKAAEALGEGVALATEFDISQSFPDCEIGAVPPFGVEYGLQTIVDVSLAEDEQIVFEGNTHHEAFRIGFEDYRNLEQPLVVDIVAD